jgi:hypothetical protein
MIFLSNEEKTRWARIINEIILNLIELEEYNGLAT